MRDSAAIEKCDDYHQSFPDREEFKEGLATFVFLTCQLPVMSKVLYLSKDL